MKKNTGKSGEGNEQNRNSGNKQPKRRMSDPKNDDLAVCESVKSHRFESAKVDTRSAMPVPAGHMGHGPSCFDRVKMGFMMGFAVGMGSGAIFGGFSALRYGLRGRELLSQVGKTMVQGGGTFGLFMSIGTGIRC